MKSELEADGRPRVLVVDDDASVRDLYATVLGVAGIEVLTAEDGLAALALLASTPVAAVLLDERMPRLSGLETLRRLRAAPHSATLPVLLVTGDGDLPRRIAGLQAGADDYLVKPVDPDELVARVEAQLRGGAAWQRLLDQQVRERAAFAEILGRLRPCAVLEDSAEQLCAALARLPQVAGAALVALSDGQALPLATVGDGTAGLRPGRPLPSMLEHRLRLRLQAGAWVEAATPAGLPAPAVGTSADCLPDEPLLPGAAGWMAYAPVHGPSAEVGVLVVRGAATWPSRDGSLLADTIDAARAASLLLGAALEARGQHVAVRTRVGRILSERGFHPVFQPVRDMRTGEVVGYEALTRFADGGRPDLVFTEAARAGLAVDLERATAAAAVRAAAALPRGGWLAVNVSAAFLTASTELPSLARLADRPLVLELTEHERVDDYRAVLSAVDRLDPVVRLAVDDTGAGYASLRHVLTLHPGFVKLDGAWTSGIDTDEARQALVSGLAHVAARMGSEVIAEGVETEAQVATLLQLGVRLGQGWLLGHPRPVQAADAVAASSGV